jgi:hypothetical protein
MANACKSVIQTGYNLLNKSDIVGLGILDILNKRDNLGNGSTFIFEVEHELVAGLAEDLTLPTSNCGVKTYKVCECNENSEVELKIDKVVSCARKFNKCASELLGENPAVALAKRTEEVARQVNADLVNSVVLSAKDGGTAVTGDLSTPEAIIEVLDQIEMAFNDAGYLYQWNPTASSEQVGSVDARYIFMDSAVFNRLRKAEGAKCCLDLEVQRENVQSMRYHGFNIISVNRMKATYGMDLMAVYAPHMLMVAKCEEQADVMTDQVSDKGTTMEKYDAIMARMVYGFKLVSPVAVQYVEASTAKTVVE